MCISPIHLKAKSTYFDRFAKLHDIRVSASLTAHAYDVPCGKCPQCLQQKRDDILLRVSHEWSKSKCHAIFATLTYDEVHIPILEYETGDFIWNFDPVNPLYPEILETPTTKYVTTWYKPHVQTYLKQLNEKLIYFIGAEILGIKRLIMSNGKRVISPEWKDYLKKSPRPLKYLVVCERGKSDTYVADNGKTRIGTSRPHYHAILILNNTLLYKYMEYVRQLSVDLWTYGNAYNINIKRPTGEDARNQVQCIEYVCKYVTKDSTDICSSVLYLDHRDKLNRKPFILLSKCLGADLLESYADLSLTVEKGITIPSSKGVRNVNCPQYNINRRTRHSVTGEISPVSVNPRLNKDVYFDGGHPCPVTFLTDEELLSVYHSQPLTHTKSYLNAEGKNLKYDNTNRKAEYYSASLLKYQQINPTKSLWNTTKTPLSKRNYHNDIDLLLSFSPDDIYLFILNDLYYFRDNSEYNDSLYQLYLLLRDINNTLTILNNRKRELEYKRNLDKSLVAKPELFNLKPLCRT